MKALSLKNQKGIGLLEVLIALLISGILVTAGFTIYLEQHRGWIIQEQVSEMQQNAKAGMRELTTRIRMAGYNLPLGVEPIAAANTNPDTITVMFQNELTCSATVEWDMPQPSSELRCDGHDVSCFQESTWAYIYDAAADTGEFFYITQVQTGSSHIQHHPVAEISTGDLSRCYPKGSIVMMIDMYKYFIDNTTDSLHPKLMVVHPAVGAISPQVYAEDIENLQFTYTVASGVEVDVPPSGLLVREVGISLVARTEKTDLQFEDQHRKRNLVSKVKIRNLGQ